MQIEIEIEEFFKDISEFASSLNGRGYDGSFSTCGGYPDDLEKSIKRYLLASMLGKEIGMRNGISLRTFLKWNGSDAESVEAYFRITPGYRNKLVVREMEIIRSAPNLAVINCVTLFPIDIEKIPTKVEGLRMVDPPLKLKSKRNMKL